ncbi:MAG: hypothetical protein RL518_1624 [Pseudomonadota bacterium]|jgi:hypothetical protein
MEYQPVCYQTVRLLFKSRGSQGADQGCRTVIPSPELTGQNAWPDLLLP